jgi:hypothetical protein
VKIVGGFTRRKRPDTLMRKLIPANWRELLVRCGALALLPVLLPKVVFDSFRGLSA